MSLSFQYPPKKDIRQSFRFAKFMESLGWEKEKIKNSFIYLKKFPFLGYFAKIPRIKPPIPFLEINNFIRTKKVFRLKIAPLIFSADKKYELYRKEFFNHRYKTENYPFNPTADILIDLTQSEEKIFQNFTSAKRRAVRRAIKNGIIIKESNDIESFIKIRKKQFFPLGFLVVKEMRKLWQNFYPENALLLLAYPTIQTLKIEWIKANSLCGERPIAGILLLFYEKIAYYWYASSLKIGKKLFAPTLLVFEGLKKAKERGCKIFAFEGIYDERFPQAAFSWRGFTKFKEGFGGEKIIYLENFSR